MATGNKETKGYIKEIKGVWHIVIVYYDTNGKRKFSSISTKLKARGNKKNATRMMEEILELFEIPKKGQKPNLKKYLDDDLETRKAKLEKIKPKKICDGKNANIQTRITPDMLFSDFLYFWVKAARNSVEENTYCTYYMTIDSRIAPYFREREIKLKELTTIDLQQFYNYAQEVELLSPSTILKRHNNINQALKYAISLGLIKSNPADNVIKPKKTKYMGAAAYSQEELSRLFQIIKGDPLELAVYLASYYVIHHNK